jgi:tripartite-type tricarboxylate transporter receptor subunit TctC
VLFRRGDVDTVVADALLADDPGLPDTRDPGGNTPDEFARFIREDQAKWSRLMREAGIKPE